MERLTEKNEKGQNQLVLEMNYGMSVPPETRWTIEKDHLNRTLTLLGGAVDKLAAYEDTGLAPEQIMEMDRLYREKCEELAGRWISIEERTPKDGARVLVCFENLLLVDIMEYREDSMGGAFYNQDSDQPACKYGIFVKAWIPLPETLEEKREEKR